MKLFFFALLAVGLPCLEAGMLFGYKHKEEAVFNWAYEKAMGQCIGKENMEKIYDIVRNFLTECFAEAYAPPKPGSQTTPTPVRNEAEAENGEFSDFQDTEKATQAPVSKGAAMPKQLKVPYYNAYQLKVLKDDLVKTIGITNCFFGKFNMTINGNGTVVSPSFRDIYKTMNFTEQLNQFIMEGIDKCEETSNDGEFLYYGKEYSDFQKKLVFFRCSFGAVVRGCMNYDFMQSASDYDLSLLGNFMSGVDDNTKRYVLFSTYSNWDRTGLWDTIDFA